MRLLRNNTNVKQKYNIISEIIEIHTILEETKQFL